MTKFCKKCSTEKPLSEFNNDKKTNDGKCRQCRACQSAYHRDYYLKNPEKFAAKQARELIVYADRNKEYRAKNRDKANKRTREWLAAHPGKAYEYHVKIYESVEGRAKHLLNSAKKRVPEGFSLTLAHVVAGIAAGHCPVTGTPFDLRVNTNGKRNRSWSPHAPSLDKIDARQGYTNENTRVVIWQYNVMKGELSDAGVLDLCRQIVARAA